MLQIKEDDKFFSRLLSKENTMEKENPSFRVTIGVPFVWEAKPGTPKHTKDCSDDHQQIKSLSIPPLTPPPSYYLNQSKKFPTKKSKMIFQGLFPKMMHRRQISSSSTFSCSSSPRAFNRSLSGSGTFFDFVIGGEEEDQEDEEEEMSSPKSTLCFGFVGNRKI